MPTVTKVIGTSGDSLHVSSVVACSAQRDHVQPMFWIVAPMMVVCRLLAARAFVGRGRRHAAITDGIVETEPVPPTSVETICAEQGSWFPSDATPHGGFGPPSRLR